MTNLYMLSEASDKFVVGFSISTLINGFFNHEFTTSCLKIGLF